MEEKKIRTFKDLHAWKEEHILVLSVYRFTKKFPKDELFALTSQMRRAAVSITSNLAEGFGRHSYKEKSQFYSISLGSVTELQNQLLISKDVGYLTPEEFSVNEEQAALVHRIIHGLIKSSREFSAFVFLFFPYSLFFLSLFLIPHSASASALIKPSNSLGLSGYWQVNEGTGATTADASGNGKTGTLQGSPSWVTSGKFGKALSFSGSQYVSTAASWPSSGSISVWVYPTAYADWISPAGWKTDPNVSTDGFILIDEGGGGTPGRWRAVFKPNVAGPGEVDVVASANIVQNTWTHLVMTWSLSGSTYTVHLYVNGVDQGSATWTGTPGSSGVGGFHFGNSGDYPDNYFLGQEDEVRIYSRALSSGEVTSLFRGGPTIRKVATQNGLVGWWKFDEGSGTTAGDSSGNKKIGTLTSGPTWTSGYYGSAIVFDGTSQYVDTTATLGTGDATVSAWFKGQNQLTGTGTIRPFVAQGSGSLFDMSMSVPSSGSFVRCTWAGDIIATTQAYNDNKWHFAACTKSGSTVSFYVDGQLIGTGASGTPNPTNIQIGGSTSNASRKFRGAVDDVRLYNRALSVLEIQGIYKGSSAIVNTSSATMQGTGLANGLIGLWTFDGKDMSWTSPSAGTATDRSGQGNTGTLNNMTQAGSVIIGKLGQALSFNGVNNYVDLGSPSGPTGAVTVAAWIYKNANTPWASILDRYGNESLDCLDFGFDNAAGQKMMFSWNNPAPFVNNVTGNSNIPNGAWTHVAVSSDGTNATFYVNGVADGTASVGAPCTTGSFDVGANFPGGDEYFNGKIDDLRLYNRALSAAEMKQLYNLGK